MAPPPGQIQHVVLLVMENRPFDMFYGFAQPVLKNKINGLTGKECFPTPGQGAGYKAREFDWWRDEDDDEEGGTPFFPKAGDDDGGDDGDDDEDVYAVDGSRTPHGGRKLRAARKLEEDDDDRDDDELPHGSREQAGISWLEQQERDRNAWSRFLRKPTHPVAGPTWPLDNKTKILYNTFVESGKPEDKFVSFADTDTPPGETGALHWLRAAYTAVTDAMPTYFEKVEGKESDLYLLRNVWPSYCPGGVCPPSYTGYFCEVQQTNGSYMFLHTSCDKSKALPLRAMRLTNGEYTMATADGKYVSFCDGGCSGGKWLAASYSSASDAMTLKLTDPGVAPPPPPPTPPGAPECVKSGAAHYVCEHGGSWLGVPPLGWNSTWDGFNPICPGGLPELCPGGNCPKLCTNGLGNTPFNSECAFPFEYDGTSYDTCVSPGTEGGYGWCPPKGYAPDGKYNGSWGGCKVCDDTHFWDGCTRYPPTNQGGWMLSGMDPEAVHQFSPEQVPIHIALAQEFALFDNYHSSFPGPSTPNHLFIMTATAAGCTTTGQDYACTSGRKYPQKTIFESLAENGHDWRYYYNDTSWNYFLEWFSTKEGAAGVVGYDEFYDRAAKGTLPAFSFVLPREGTNATTGQGSNDDHPCHDIALGELLIKQTYEAVRASPAWNRTLMLVTYDDTGGWYDHADIPTGAPRPDDYPACSGTYDFQVLGMRAPTLLISPWVSKGKVIGDPDGPTPTSLYEHSSIAATVKSLFNLPDFLTKRDAWAGDFSKELDLDEPSNQGPMHLPEAPTITDTRTPVHVSTGSGGPGPVGSLTRRQRRRMEGLARINRVPVPQVSTHAEAEAWISQQEARHRRESLGRDEL